MTKRTIALLMLIFMIGSLLVGCGADAKDGNENSDNQQGNQNQDIVNNNNEQNNTESNNSESNSDSGNKNESSTEGENNNESNQDSGSAENRPSKTPSDELTVGTEIGDLMASVSLEKIDGGSVSIEDYRGKIIIFNIWATWCPPCKAELPDFDRIAKENANEVVVIAVHLPSGSENAPSYVSTNFPDSNIIFAYDTSSYSAFYAAGGANSVPRTAILDENGVIVYAQDGLMYYDDVISIIEDIKAD